MTRRRVAGGGLVEQAEGDGPVGVQQVDAFVAAGIVRGVCAAVDAVVAQGEEKVVDAVGVGCRDQEIHVRGRADDAVRGQRQAADQRGW